MTSAINGFSGLPALAGVKEAKLREPVFPGHRLEFDGHIIHDGSGFAMAECQGRREGKVVCSAGLTYRIIPYPSGTFRQTMLDMARALEFPLEEFLRD
jgi:3-hydroxyacyl-[acyl-carrier-protein] dehydratase